MAATVWTPARRWLGNLIPALFWLPPALYGLALIVRAQAIVASGLWCLILATVLGWLALNAWGLFGNRSMRKQLEAQLGASLAAHEHYFVGFASPSYGGVVDAHEDVGFLVLHPDQLLFVSETRRVEMMRSDVREVRFRPNPHTMLGLGRWISIEGSKSEKSFRMLVEPRERSTMLANLRYSRKLRNKLTAWSRGTASGSR